MKWPFTALTWVLIFSLTSSPARATEGEVLTFYAKIQQEALAEEAIDLLHCLAERRAIPWELGLEDKPPSPSLSLREKDGRLEGLFRDGAERRFTLEQNGWRRTCEELAPRGGPAPASLGLSTAPFPEEAPELEKKFPWLWVGLGVVAAASAVLLLRPREASHRSLRMD